jgi:hypothetical protein
VRFQFWIVVEEYKQLGVDSVQRLSCAQDIYERFLAPHSRNELNVTKQIKDKIADRLEFHSDNLFDEPQREVFQLMLTNNLREFLASNLCRDFLLLCERILEIDRELTQEK